ncbi:hypothetical protein Pla52n_02520 [Stieleria varia]|uniref:Uncharacterized protein n=1 Tax=Stieleria varia TaxID=2528005 RepID=A0A5C6B8Q6_9BACT|nr:hypothetical protein Pla52n_02520 [Stieleria varia]
MHATQTWSAEPSLSSRSTFQVDSVLRKFLSPLLSQLVAPSEPQSLAVGLRLRKFLSPLLSQLVAPSEPQALAVGLRRIVVPTHG